MFCHPFFIYNILCGLAVSLDLIFPWTGFTQHGSWADARVVIGKCLYPDESAIEGQRGEPLSAASLLCNRALLGSSGVRAQGAVPSGTAPLAPPC